MINELDEQLTGLGVVEPLGGGDPVEVGVAGGDGGPLSVSGPGGDTEVVASSEGQASEIDLPDGRHQSLRYDTGGRLESVALDGTVAATYRYDPVGRLVASGNADGLVEERSYDLAGRLTGIVRPDGSAWAATWTPAGRIESVTEMRFHPTRPTQSRGGEGGHSHAGERGVTVQQYPPARNGEPPQAG